MKYPKGLIKPENRPPRSRHETGPGFDESVEHLDFFVEASLRSRAGRPILKFMEATRFRVLAVDDDFTLLERIKAIVGRVEYPRIELHTAETVRDALEVLDSRSIDLVLSDFRLPDGNGLDLLRRVKSSDPTVSVVIMTAFEDIRDAVSILKAGGEDYLVKPVTAESLEHIFIREYEKQTIEHESDELDPFLSPESSDVPFIHADPRMREVLSAVYRARESSATVLITGESGTGKELVARLIHDASDRRDKPFVTVNIAALPETLMESELFGHVKGAFTGADQPREGRFAEGDGGSLFIDEVGDIPLSIQVKLLRALQFGEIQRVGENATRTLDVRIIAATNRDLRKMMDQGAFRADLYWRLNVIPISIPPLRERRGDIAALTRWFIEKYSKEYRKPVRGISREALSELMRHPFPGNVRELENAVERAVLMTRREILSTQDIRLEPVSDAPLSSGGPITRTEQPIGTYDEMVGRFELDLISKALDTAGGNQSEAARTLGIGERRLRSRLKVLNEKLGPGL